MTVDELLLDARLGEIDREVAGAALARTLAELYAPCACGPRPRKGSAACAQHAVDPGLFRRLIWAGLGS